MTVAESLGKTPEVPDTDVVRLSVNLSRDVALTLRNMAQQQGVTVTEALRRAIGTEKFLRDETSTGSKILIEDTNNKFKQIILR